MEGKEVWSVKCGVWSYASRNVTSGKSSNLRKRLMERKVVMSQTGSNPFLGLGYYRTIEDQKNLEKRLKAFNFVEG